MMTIRSASRAIVRSAVLALPALLVAGCAHRPETVVHLSAPAGSWVARSPSGTRLCALPCSVELDPNDSVVVAREGAPPRRGATPQAFVVEQSSLGPGAWTGAVHVRRDPTEGGLALKTFAGALMTAGESMAHARSDDKRVAGIVLTGLGAVSAIAGDAWKGPPREELHLQRLPSAKD